MLVMLAVMSRMCNYIVGYINYVQLQYSMLLCYVIHAELGTSDNCCDNLILYEQKTASCRILDADPNPASENCGLTLNFAKITSRTVCCDCCSCFFLYRICIYNFNNITVDNNFHTFLLSLSSWSIIQPDKMPLKRNIFNCLVSRGRLAQMIKHSPFNLCLIGNKFETACARIFSRTIYFALMCDIEFSKIWLLQCNLPKRKNCCRRKLLSERECSLNKLVRRRMSNNSTMLLYATTLLTKPSKLKISLNMSPH